MWTYISHIIIYFHKQLFRARLCTQTRCLAALYLNSLPHLEVCSIIRSLFNTKKQTSFTQHHDITRSLFKKTIPFHPNLHPATLGAFALGNVIAWAATASPQIKEQGIAWNEGEYKVRFCQKYSFPFTLIIHILITNNVQGLDEDQLTLGVAIFMLGSALVPLFAGKQILSNSLKSQL